MLYNGNSQTRNDKIIHRRNLMEKNTIILLESNSAVITQLKAALEENGAFTLLRICAHIEVHVVFPWLPATVMT